jgi:hypothetical protein
MGNENRAAGGEPYRGHAGVQRCGDWCRHFMSLDEDCWPGFGRCVHPLSVRNGQVFRAGPECAVGEAAADAAVEAEG